MFNLFALKLSMAIAPLVFTPKQGLLTLPDPSRRRDSVDALP